MRYFIAAIFLLLSMTLRAQDSLSVSHRLWNMERLSERFMMADNGNPATLIFRYSHSLTQLSVDGDYHQESSPLFMQMGDGYYGGAFHAASHQKMKKNIRLWGEAFYKNGVKKNITWNETSDLNLLYPYLTADSTGGDLHSETCFFRGGYAQEFRKIVWAAEAEYRALLEHRNIDPRPRNTVADMKLRLAVGRNLFADYYGILAIYLQRYKQTGSVVYYSELGNRISYHLTGLGMEYTRFAGTNTSVGYRGNGIGASLNLLPRNKMGFSLRVDYLYFSFDKMLTGLNNLPIVTLNAHTIDLSGGWQCGKEQQQWGAKIEAELLFRNGIENIFGDPADHVYPQIATADMYQNKILRFALAGFYEWETHRQTVWMIRPEIIFTDYKEVYIYPEREITGHYLMSHFNFGWSRMMKKVSLLIDGDLGYHFCMDEQHLFSEFSSEDKLYDLVQNRLTAYQSDALSTQLSLRINIPTGKKMAVFAQLSGQYLYYKLSGLHAQTLQLKLGVML